jgi:hypothetical protein
MFYLIKAAVPHMKPGGAIINTASINSDSPNPILLAYALSFKAFSFLELLPTSRLSTVCRQPRYYGNSRSRGV